jgi:hypothetical protein
VKWLVPETEGTAPRQKLVQHDTQGIHVGRRRQGRPSDLLGARGLHLLVHQPSYNLLNRWIEDGLLGVLGEEGIGGALEGVSCTYVAFDADVLEPSELAVFMPEPDGVSLVDAERILAGIAAGTTILGAGFTGATFEPGNVPPLARLATALGL